MLVYSTSPTLNNPAQLYVNSELTIPTTAPWFSNNINSYQMAGNIIQGVIPCT
jgi:hypothetical protein